MKQYKTVKPYTGPSAILKNFSPEEQVCEMSESEHGFLCGLLRDRRPRKIVEVGVAEGGTTAVILKCARELNLDCTVYSVDVAEKLYYDPLKDVGFVLKKMGKNGNEGGCDNHRLLLGKFLPERLDEIGDGIDFLILDTVHVLPGEILDFIAAFPYLAHDAVVVLHDTCLHYAPNMNGNEVATSVLLQSVVADKFLNIQDRYPNIAAFQINQDSYTYFTDMFSALILPWAYLPEDRELALYEAAIQKHYNAQCLRLFQQAVAKAKEREESSSLLWRCNGFQHVLLYGKGKRGRAFLQCCSSNGIKIDGFVVSDGHAAEKISEGLPVYTYLQIPFQPEETLIIQTAASSEITERLRNSSWRWVDIPDTFWWKCFRL